ncbi:nucleotidyltransferase family protein [Aestuariicella sp. G3-2]|uniref:nucleotidyltransferase family protein n=1 Tax=Pseudomaricurvus albidus TaxID=2842452 RepID=UPI001C0C5BBE|nr:nucleotidyltransferase family protein [Aestuariicella albida]MBU3070387.1 nucleotidyltransferase family protein [Aestuariicella albida]
MTVVAGVILAAGRGRRFGGDKLLAEIKPGLSVIECSVAAVSEAVSEYVCVVRPDDLPLQKHLTKRNIPWIMALAADDGMSQSLIAGVSHFPNADGWLICLGDMPYLKTETCRRLCGHFQELSENQDTASIVTPVVSSSDEYGKPLLKRGNPVLFSHHFKQELQQLTGDGGGKYLLSAHRNHVVRVTVNDPGILKDIDTPEDLKS